MAGGASAVHRSVVLLYVIGMMIEWLQVLYVWLGIRRKGVELRDLIGGSWSSARRIWIDLSLGFGVWLLYVMVDVTPVGLIHRLL